MGHYPTSLFMGNQSVFLNSGRSRGHIGLGVKFVTPTMLTAELPPIWATVIFRIAHRLCAMAAWPTTTAPLSFLLSIPTCTTFRATSPAIPDGAAMCSSVDPEPAKKLPVKDTASRSGSCPAPDSYLRRILLHQKSLRPGEGIFCQLSRQSLWLVWCRCCRCIRLRFGSLGIRFCWRWVRLRLGLGIWLRFRLRRDADQLYLKDQR